MTLDDNLIRLQIDLLRHDAYLRRETMRRLGKAQREALVLLLAGKGGHAALRSGYAQTGEWLEDALSDLMPVAAAAFALTYRAHLGDGFDVPEKLKVPEVYGASVTAWLTEQAGKQAFILRRLARLGREEKMGTQALAELVRKQWQPGNAQVETLVRTATAAATSDANLAVMMKSRRVKYLIHKSHLDTRTTGVCRARHNKRWTKALEPVGHDLEFKQPPLHWNCRSIIKPLLNDDLREEDDFDFDEWLEKMPANIREKALGKEKAAIWAAAKAKGQPLTIQDLLDQKGRELSLHELSRRYPEVVEHAQRAKPLTKQAQKVKISQSEAQENISRWLGVDRYRQIAGQLENPRIKKLMQEYGLSQEEGVILRYYTGSGYREINGFLREGGDNPALAKAVQVMRQGLDKLPDYTGQVVRRTRLPDHILAKHTIGEVVEYPEFISTTFGKTDVFDNLPHRLVIHSKHGKKIDWLSYYGADEEEVLFTSPTRFAVTKTRRTEYGYEIELMEWEGD